MRQGLRASFRPDRGLVRSWTAVTVLSLVVGTLGITEIARRVFDPLHLDGRSEAAQPIEVADREDPTVVLTRIPVDTTPFDADEVHVAPARSAEAPTSPAAVDGTWEVVTAPTSTTRWARTSSARGGTWSLVFDDVDGTARPGYGNNGETTLVTPWLQVPATPDPWATGEWQLSFEPDFDRLEVAWTTGDGVWATLITPRGALGPQPWASWRAQLPALDGPVRLRFRFTSDVASSPQDGSVGWPLTEGFQGVAIRDITVGTGEAASTLGVAVTPPILGPLRHEPRAVVAVSEIANPYHEEFRDRTPRAYAHPSTYLPGYPADAVAVWLSLDVDYAEAVARDAEVWAQLRSDTLYWFPGTRIIAARSASAPCPTTPCLFDGAAALPGTGYVGAAAGAVSGACPTCLIATASALGGTTPDPTQIGWFAEHSAWIDAQAVLWEPGPIGLLDAAATEHDTRFILARRLTEEAVRRHVVLSISQTASPWPVLFTDGALRPHGLSVLRGAPQFGASMTESVAGTAGVVTVDIHDRGHVVDVAKDPPTVLAQGCRRTGPRADDTGGTEELTGQRTGATSWAAGRAVQILLDARTILGETRSGIRNGVAARAARGAVLPVTGPLSDGIFTLDEWKRVLFTTATPRPESHPDGPACETVHHDLTGGDPHVGNWSWTLPVAYQDLPPGYPVWTLAGYGAIDADAARDLVDDVLHGRAPLPDRPDEDRWFAVDGEARTATSGVIP